MRRLLRLTSFTMVALLATGCATLNVGSHVQRDLDFAQFHTYDWGPADALPIGDPRLDQNPAFRDEVEGAVEKGMAARGFALATTGTPDLLIHYHASINPRIAIDRLDPQHSYCPEGDCRVGVIQFETGTLVLDVVDARTNSVIWRGWVRSGVDDILHNRARMAQRIREGVRRMMARLPNALSPQTPVR